MDANIFQQGTVEGKIVFDTLASSFGYPVTIEHVMQQDKRHRPRVLENIRSLSISLLQLRHYMWAIIVLDETMEQGWYPAKVPDALDIVLHTIELAGGDTGMVFRSLELEDASESAGVEKLTAYVDGLKAIWVSSSNHDAHDIAWTTTYLREEPLSESVVPRNTALDDYEKLVVAYRRDRDIDILIESLDAGVPAEDIIA